MPKIRFICTTTVQAASCPDESVKMIDLTPWDLELLLVGPIQKGLLFHKPPRLSSPSLIHHLKTTLSRTLSYFPPLAGRLTAVKHKDTTTSFFIHCNNAGAQLTHVVAENFHAADILISHRVHGMMNNLFAQNEAMNYEGVTRPLLAVQVTELGDGVFIGCTINHTVADGSSFWHFFNSWAEISGGLDEISRPPVLQRWFPTEISPPIRIHFCEPKRGEHFKSPPLQEMVFHFTKEKIAWLKTQANCKMGSTEISSLQAIMAHIWLAVVRSKKLGPDQEIKFKFLISARSRIRPPLPKGYFGNAVHFQALTVTAGDLENGGFSSAALQMNKMIAQQTSDEILKFLKDWVQKPKIVKMGDVTSNALILSSSPRFDVYGCDFGWGKPVAVRSGSGNKHDGKLTVYPGMEEGTIDIEFCLLPETLAGLKDDIEFMKNVTISGS